VRYEHKVINDCRHQQIYIATVIAMASCQKCTPHPRPGVEAVEFSPRDDVIAECSAISRLGRGSFVSSRK